MKTNMPGGSRSRITLEQRRLMLEFIKQNPAIATGRFDGPDGAKARSKLLNEMADILNGQGSGATKTPEKWLRSWQDWKSDTKRKAAEIARQAQGTNEGPCSALSELERDLVDLIGGNSTTTIKVPEPLAPGTSKPETMQTGVQEPQKHQLLETDIKVEVTTENVTSTIIKEPPKKRKKIKINSNTIDSRMVSAIERQAESNAEVARQIGKLADVGLLFLKTWAKLNNIDTGELSEYIVGK